MDGVEGIIEQKLKVINSLKDLDQNFRELKSLILLTLALDSDRRFTYQSHRDLEEILMILEVQIELDRKITKLERSSSTSVKRNADSIYVLLNSIFIDCRLSLLNHRPLIDIFLDICDLRLQQFIKQEHFYSTFENLKTTTHQIRRELSFPIESQIIFYADFFPYKSLDINRQDTTAQKIFRSLVNRLTLLSKKINGGRIERLPGTDTIRGKFPISTSSLKFLTTDIRKITQDFFGEDVPSGWSIGISTKPASIFFGIFDEGEGLEDAARLMEKADENMRASHRALKGINHKLEGFKGQTLISYESYLKLCQEISLSNQAQEIQDNSVMEISWETQTCEFIVKQ